MIETKVIKPKLTFTENNKEYILLDKEYEEKLDSGIEEVKKFMEENDGEGKPENEKDKLYLDAQEKWKEYARTLKDTKYNFFLNRKQYKFLYELIKIKMEYDVNTIFFAIELTDMLNRMKENKSNDDTPNLVQVNATEITYVYHLISKHKVKGLSSDSYTFSEVLIKIGEISKIFNYYDTASKHLTGDIQDWVAAFEPNVTIEKKKEEKPLEETSEETSE
jgi:hypothetical protein